MNSISNRQPLDPQTPFSIRSSPVTESGRIRSTLSPGSAATAREAIHEIGVPQAVPCGSHGQDPRIDSEVSIGPLLTGIVMMMFIRRHRQ